LRWHRSHLDQSQLIETVVNGQLITVQRLDANAVQVSKQDYSYALDQFRRLYRITDARNGSTTNLYNNADQIQDVLSQKADDQTAAQTISYAYDTSLRVGAIFYPDSSVRMFNYNKAQLQQIDGGGAYSVGYGYDYQGRVATMQTFQGTTPLLTTFKYHNTRNLLTERQFPDPVTGAKPSTPDIQNIKYEYTKGGRVKKRFSPPDPSVSGTGTRLVSWYSYAFEAGTTRFTDVTKIEYKTETNALYTTGPNTVVFTPDRAGRGPEFVVFDGVTTSLGYDFQGAVASESYAGGELAGLSVNQGRDSLLRKGTFTANNGATTLASATFDYDAASRVKSISDGTYWARYTYDANSSLVKNIDFGKGNGPSVYTAMTWDKLNRLRHTQTQEYARQTALQSRDFTYDVADRVQTSTLEDGEKWTYGYNTDFGHLNSAHKTWPAFPNGSPQVVGQQFDYTYDTAGNRLTIVNGATATALYNKQNQLTSRDVPGAIEVLGFADFNSTLTIKKDGVSTGAAERYSDYFRQRVTVANFSSAAWTDINVQADSTITSGKVFTGKTPEVIDDTATTTINEGYDGDGNLRRDGRWIYTWDAQNRLISMKARDVVAGQQSRLVRIDFGYDWRGRRISKKVYPYLSGSGDNWTASATPTLQRKFLYDGWNLIAELDGANNAVVRSYLWGLDLAGQKGGGFADAGGIGGLVAVRSGAEAHFYMQDGLGNVSLTYDAVRQTESSRYEFGPFGEILRANGTWTANNPIRHSSKYWDSESDLSYFGYRYYNPAAGRWLSRDPLGESAGANLYGYVGNAVPNAIDPTGDQNMYVNTASRDALSIQNAPVVGTFTRTPVIRAVPTLLFPAPLGSTGIMAVPTSTRDWQFGVNYYNDVEFKAEFAPADPIPILAAFVAENIVYEVAGEGLGNIFRLGKLSRLECSALAMKAGKTGRLGGRIVTRAEIDRINSILKKRKAWINPNADRYMNQYYPHDYAVFERLDWPPDASRIVLRRNATQYELYHELKHWGDFNREGPAAFEAKYGGRFNLGAEESVYKYISKQNWLTPEQAAHAKNYIESVRQRSKIGY
jgi:RHS repeat-associated protein